MSLQISQTVILEFVRKLAEKLPRKLLPALCFPVSSTAANFVALRIKSGKLVKLPRASASLTAFKFNPGGGALRPFILAAMDFVILRGSKSWGYVDEALELGTESMPSCLIDVSAFFQSSSE